MTSTHKISSWGTLEAEVNCLPYSWRHEPLDIAKLSRVLPYGMGRSYGDSCLVEEGGTAILTRGLNRMIDFDRETGILICEAGLLLGDLASWALPLGYFLPVSPGTQFVTVGGAVANDVHGKNHHRDGSFGDHVIEFTLRRSDEEIYRCSREENPELFRATIGGLGLTGLLVTVKLHLKPVAGPYIDQEQIRFSTLREALNLFDVSANHQYVVSWIDCLSASKRGNLRGILYRGHHSPKRGPSGVVRTRELQTGPTVPPVVPGWALNRYSVCAFNRLYDWKGKWSKRDSTIHYKPFFYPLDSLQKWNRIYGKNGLLQYQCVVPFADAETSIGEMLSQISKSGLGSFLGVLKSFGASPAPGMLSFARPGVTLALDFKNDRGPVFDLFDRLDRVVQEAGGALYPAKDQRMSPEMFERSFKNLRLFKKYVDPKFSSMFWKRVTHG